MEGLPRTPRGGRRGFTLIELLVVIAIIAILAAILFPVFAKARNKARQVQCLSNMKQIAYALHMYADDNDQTYPGWNIYTDAGGNLIAWDEAIMPYLTSSKVYLCGSQRNQNAKPTAQTFWGRNYSMNAFYGSGEGYPFPCIYVASLKRPADRILISETSGGYGYHNPHVWSPADRSMIVTNDETMTAGLYTTMTPLLHNGGSNYIFCDTHVQWLKYSRTVEGFPNDMWNLQNQ